MGSYPEAMSGPATEGTKPTQPARTFDVFLAHNGIDKATVTQIAVALKRAGLEPWLDVWELPGGERFHEGLASGLAASDSCAVVVGGSDLGAWTNEEVAVAIDR